MSIFNLSKKKKRGQAKKISVKKSEKKSSDAVEEKKESPISENIGFSNAEVIIRPRITEKATIVQEGNVYVFEVFSDATKSKVSKAIKEIYKVEPKKVNVVNSPSKKVFIRGKIGTKSGVKKAYVYLKEGDKIEIV